MKISACIVLLLLLLFHLPAVAGTDGGGRVGAYLRTPLPPEPGDDLSEGIVRVELQGIASQTLFVRFSGDTLFLPLAKICDFLRIPVSASDDFSEARGEFPLGRSFFIAGGSSAAFSGDDSITFNPLLVRALGDDIYIEQSLLARWLGLMVEYDVERLRFIITAEAKIPRVQLARDKRRYSSLLRDDTPRLLVASVMDRQLIGYPTFDWALAATRTSDASRLRGGTQVGMPFLYGILNLNGSVGYDHLDTTATDLALNWWTWRFLLPDFDPLQRIAVGGSRTGDIRQFIFEASNEPLAPRLTYGTEALTGLAEPGWTIELYDGTQLVDVQKADSTGFYQFEIPLGYGTTDRTIVQVGPHGERIIEERHLELNPLLVPPGQVQYQARFTNTSYPIGDQVEAVAYTGVGVTSRLTLGAEAALVSSGGGPVSFDSLYPAVSANLWLGGSGFLGLRYNPRWSLLKGEISWLGGDNTILKLGVDSLSLLHGTFITNGTASFRLGPFICGATAQYAKVGITRVVQLLPRIAGYFSGISFNASTDLKWRGIEIPDAAGGGPPYRRSLVSDLYLLSPVVPGVLLTARGSYDHDAHLLNRAELGASFYLSRIVNLNVAYNVAGSDWANPKLQLQLKVNVNRAAGLTVSGDYYNHEFAASTYMQGSATVSTNGVHFSRHPSSGQTTIILRAFKDDNGNGEYDSGEEELGAQSGRLNFGSSQIASKTGMFTFVPANRECVVEIDRWGYAELALFPRKTVYGIFSAPSSVHVIDVPYTGGFDVSGRCDVFLPGSSETLKTSALLGLNVRLVSSDGASSYDGEIFHDGSIMVAGVAEGEYRLEFDEAQLQARRLRLRSSPERVALGSGNTRIPAVEFEPVAASGERGK